MAQGYGRTTELLPSPTTCPAVGAIIHSNLMLFWNCSSSCILRPKARTTCPPVPRSRFRRGDEGELRRCKATSRDKGWAEEVHVLLLASPCWPPECYGWYGRCLAHFWKNRWVCVFWVRFGEWWHETGNVTVIAWCKDYICKWFAISGYQNICHSGFAKLKKNVGMRTCLSAAYAQEWKSPCLDSL
jgi:hypothetical protein